MLFLLHGWMDCSITFQFVADEGELRAQFGTSEPESLRRLACFERAAVAEVSGSEHKVRHDRPERLAAESEAFFERQLLA